jgi:TonB family protein
MFALLAVLLLVPALQQPPRDGVRPGLIGTDGTAVEAALERKIADVPGALGLYLELAQLQEGRGALQEAEATLLRARQADPTNARTVSELAHFYTRRRDFEKTMAMLELGADLAPSDAAAQHLVASYYWEKATKDLNLLPAEQFTYVTAGLAASDRALGINPDYVDALVYKGLLLRKRADLETDPAQKQRTIAEATALQRRAIEIRTRRAPADPTAGTLASHGPRDPLPSPMAPVRIGGTLKPPAKIKNVGPVYPPEAKAAGISGVVIMDVTLGVDGRVVDTKVLRSIPELDQAAIDAVMQWEFTPTLLNGQPVPVIMTVTVNFTLALP